MYKFKTPTRIQLSYGVLGFYGDQPHLKIPHIYPIIQDRRTRQYFIFLIFFAVAKLITHHSGSVSPDNSTLYPIIQSNSRQYFIRKFHTPLVPVEKVVRRRFCLPFLVENRFTRFNVRTTVSIQNLSSLFFSDSIESDAPFPMLSPC